MAKTVFVINGRGGVGKDTLVDVAASAFRVKNISSITPIKEIAKSCGWQGEKTDKARRFLADIKAACVLYNDLPTRVALEEYRAFLSSDDEVMFVHIREPEEIEKFVRGTGGAARTLLIRATKRMPAHHYGNAADDLVEHYPYDLIFDNDGTPEEAKAAFLALLSAEIGEGSC